MVVVRRRDRGALDLDAADVVLVQTPDQTRSCTTLSQLLLILKKFWFAALPALPRWTAVFQFACRLRGILLQTQETHRIMAGQNHQRTTLYNIMILSHHDSVRLGCGWCAGKYPGSVFACGFARCLRFPPGLAGAIELQQTSVKGDEPRVTGRRCQF